MRAAEDHVLLQPPSASPAHASPTRLEEEEGSMMAVEAEEL